MLDQEKGSIIKFFQTVNPGKIYIEEVPKDFVTPSMYFPPPFLDTSRSSFSSYQKDYQMFVKVFEETKLAAAAKGEKIIDELNKNRNIIKLYDVDGNLTNESIKISKVNGKIIDDGAYQIEINWKSGNPLGREIVQRINNINFNLNLGGA